MRKVCLLLSVAAVAVPAVGQAQDVVLKPIVEARLRYETVDQDGIARDADAVTMRLRAGGEISKGPFAFLAPGAQIPDGTVTGPFYAASGPDDA